MEAKIAHTITVTVFGREFCEDIEWILEDADINKVNRINKINNGNLGNFNVVTYEITLPAGGEPAHRYRDRVCVDIRDRLPRVICATEYHEYDHIFVFKRFRERNSSLNERR